MSLSERFEAFVREREEPQVISFRSMRAIIGLLSFALPIATSLGYLWLTGGTGTWLGSISEYYFTAVRDVFVGTLCVVGFFLIPYKGYSHLENWVFHFAGTLSLLIAFFSTDPVVREVPPTMTAVRQECQMAAPLPSQQCLNDFGIVFENRALLRHPSYFGTIHIVAAGLMFFTLSFASFFLFTRTRKHRVKHSDEKPTTRKKIRNVIYRLCGATIFFSLILYGVANKVTAWGPLAFFADLFHVEAICLWAFGLSWLTKAEMVPGLADPKPQTSTAGVSVSPG